MRRPRRGDSLQTAVGRRQLRARGESSGNEIVVSSTKEPHSVRFLIERVCSKKIYENLMRALSLGYETD